MTLSSWTDDQILAQLLSGSYWSTSTITFSFPTSSLSIYGAYGEGVGFIPLSPAAQNDARLALQLWDDLIAPNMVEVPSGSSYASSDIEFGISTTLKTASSYAYARFPSVGSIWFSYDNSGSDNLVDPMVGDYGFETYIHELGHTLGLNHMGNYNAGDGVPVPSSYQDSTVYSVMSYFGPDQYSGEGLVAWADWIGSDGAMYSPQTPMLNDILAIQAIYGADLTTRTGNTTYGFNCNITGSTSQIYNFSINLHPIMTIYDAGGEDTLDLSGYITGSVINLTAGQFSSCNYMTNNIAIAYGCTIENALGGGGNDLIYGNFAANILVGFAGDDAIYGYDGNDILSGGIGSDTLVGGSGFDFVSYALSSAGITVNLALTSAQQTGGEGVDTISEIEGVIGSSLSDAILGNAGDNRFLGLSGNDIINGGAGTDYVFFNDSQSQCTITFSSGNCIVSTATEGTDTLSNIEYLVFNGVVVAVSDLNPSGDTIAPIVSTFSPFDAATGVAVGSNIVLTFSETIKAGSGTIAIRAGSPTGTIVESFDVATSTRITISGSTLTIDPTNDLASGTNYYVVLPSGAVLDLAGNAYAGTTTYDFTTAPPVDDYPNSTSTNGVVVVGGSSSAGAIEISGDADAFKVVLTAGTTYTFTLNSTTSGFDTYLELYSSAAALLASNNDVGGGSTNSQITLTATTSGDYYLSVSANGTGTGSYTLTASVADTTAPTVSTFLPSDAATGVAVGSNIVLTFSEAVKPGTGTLTIRAGSPTGTIVESFDIATSTRISISGSTLTIDPISDLANGTSYYVVLPSGAVLDLAGNAYVGTSTYDFTTVAAADDYPNSTATAGVVSVGGAAATGVIETSGDADLFKVVLTAGVTYTFSLNSNASSGLNTYLALYSPSVVLLASNDDAGGGSTNSQITFTATTSGTYYLQASAYGSTTGSYSLTATGADVTAPTVSAFSPSDAATSVAVGSNIVLTFSEAVKVGTGTITIRAGSATGTIIESFDIATSTRVTISGSTLTIDPTSNLSNSTNYYVVLPSGAVLDLAGNAYAGTSTYDFTTVAPADDYPNTTATTGVVTIGGSASTGVIEVAGDGDAFKVVLTAGVTYTFTQSSTTPGLDTYLQLYSPTVALLASNDNLSGSSTNSQIVFTAQTSGTYYLLATSSGSTTGSYTLTATGADITAPTVSTFTPADATTGVAVGSNIVLTFSEAVKVGTGTITIRAGSPTGTIVESFDAATSNRITISGFTLTIDPTNNLANGTSYYVVLPSGAVLDLAGNAYAGTSTYDFTTVAAGNVINGTTNADTLTGTTGVDIINGLAGNDIITGGAGIDVMDGGDGADIYIIAVPTDHGAAEVNDTGPTGTDEIRFTSATANSTLTLYAGDVGLERAVIGTGTAAAAVTTGTTALNINAAALTYGIALVGNAGANILTSGAGNDTLTGNGGIDTFTVTAGTDAITDLGTGGADILNVAAGATVNATVTAAWTASSATVNKGIVNITTNGLAVNLAAVTATTAGNLGYNITNIGAATTLTGSALADRLTGGTGNDVIVGGAGIDVLNGAGGSDIYTVAAPADHSAAEFADTGTSGIDEVRFTSATASSTLTLYAGDTGLERVVIGTGTGSSAVVTGTTALNINAAALTYGIALVGNAGANTLTGGAGDDILQGGAGNDTLIGGNGYDYADYSTATTAITANLSLSAAQNTGGAGTDTLSGIEGVIGGAAADILTGDANANVLFGKLGNDTLTGGGGIDWFVFDTTPNATSNKDTITDFVSGTDKLYFNKTIFTGLSSASVGALSADAFWSGAGVTAAHDATDRFIYNTTTGVLYYDPDGTGSAAAVQVALLGATTHPTLAYTDIMVFA